MTIAELNNLIKDYIKLAKLGTHKQNGYADSNYSMSKLGVIQATRIMSRNDKYKAISFLSMCPGYCATDMTLASKAIMTPIVGNIKSAAEGAKTAVMLAIEPEYKNVTGNFYSDEKLAEF